MIQAGLAASLESIIKLMYETSLDDSFVLEDSSRGLLLRVNPKPGALMSLELHVQKDKERIEFKREEFPIFVYHNSIARLTPIYNQLLFLEKHPKTAHPDLFMSFAATLSNIGLMLGEQSLIKTEHQISEMLPASLKDELVIVCGPIGEFFVTTIHIVKLNRETTLETENVTLWRQFVPDTTFPHRGKEYIALESLTARHKYKTQTSVLAQLKALQMLLSAISVNLGVDADEAEEKAQKD
jgi:hypothetical protein